MGRANHSQQCQKAHTLPAAHHNGVNGTHDYPTSTPRTAARSSHFEPTMASFLPGDGSQAYTTQIKGPIASELARIERNVLDYNTAHQLEIVQFQDDTSKNSADITGLAKNLNSLKTDFNNNLHELKVDFTNNVDDPKSETRISQEQSNKNSEDLSDMKIVLRNDFHTIGSQLKASNAAVQEMNATIVATQERRQMMRSFMLARTLAEAESLELQARRLRESVRLLGSSPGMLQLPAVQSDHGNSVEAAPGQSADTPSPTVSRDAAPVVPSSVNDNGKSELDVQGEHARAGAGADTSATQPSTKWQPHAIAGLIPLSISRSPPYETFTWEELHRHLGGAQYSPGLYFTCNDAEDRVLKDLLVP